MQLSIPKDIDTTPINDDRLIVSKLWQFCGHLCRLIMWMHHASKGWLQKDEDNRFWKVEGFSWTKNGWDFDSGNPGLYPSIGVDNK